MNSKSPLSLYCLMAFFVFFACSPKVGEKTTQNQPPETPVVEEEEEVSTCKNWNKSPRKDVIIEAHVLYKDQLREIRTEIKKGRSANKKIIDSLYHLAFELWMEAYEQAPAADGKRADHFEDGIKIYNYFHSVATDESKKKEYVANIMKLYDERAECYGEEGYISGRKGFDYYYKYPEQATDMEKYKLLKQSLLTDSEDANYFILNPLTALLSNLLLEKKIPVEEAQKLQALIRQAIKKGLANCKNAKECEPWKIVEGYAPARLEQLEGIENFYDCQYYINRYFSEFEADPTNCEVINEVASRLRWGKCAADNPKLAQVEQAKRTHCFTPLPTAGDLRQAKEALEAGRFREAIGHYESYISKSDNAEKKAIYALRIAKIYYVHLKNFAKARRFARESMKYNPNSGQPLMLIGRLYASSGPLCGPGRGWDSQVVTWPAIDKWSQAKRMDSSVAAEANKFISRYKQYMPSVEDVFQRGLKEGDTFKVGCWIQETTTIRAAR